MNEPAIQFEDVSFAYPTSTRPALDHVELAVAEGVFALITGTTGSGKSTLLRAANGLVPHFTGGVFAGHVRVAGRDTLAHAPRELADTAAFVPQDPAASFVLDRVEDELAYGMENLSRPPEVMRRRVEEMLDLLAIAPLRDRSVRDLSGGEQQRVAIAAALAAGPRMLVLDEPTSQLDPQGAEDVLAALQRLVHDHGMTVLCAEHRLERVAGFTDIAIGVAEGQVTSGDPREIFAQIGNGPPVFALGRLAGWSPLPLTVRDARTLAGAHALALGEPREPTQQAPGELRVRTKGLVAGYRDAPVLKGIDFDVREGEIVALMGRNGAGKSTLLRAIIGLLEPERGSVEVAGSSPPRPGADAGLCPQEPESILFADSAADEVRATLKARDIQRDPIDVLTRLGIADLADQHPRDLSSGQRLLVALAAVVAAETPVLLLDEPTRGLDPAAKLLLRDFLRAHAAAGHAIIFATHDVELVADVASRVVMVAQGEIIADGDPAAVLGDSHVFAPQMTRVFGPGWLTVAQVGAAMGAHP